jgi:hypothetical protein
VTDQYCSLASKAAPRLASVTEETQGTIRGALC